MTAEGGSAARLDGRTRTQVGDKVKVKDGRILSFLGCPLANSAFISEERAELTVSDTSSLFESGLSGWMNGVCSWSRSCRAQNQVCVRDSMPVVRRIGSCLERGR
jgi:hypothetical protein